MMLTLDQYLKKHLSKGFRSIPHCFKDGNYISIFFSDERCYAKQIHKFLTGYYSDVTNELIGYKIEM